jgi:catechol 2,3-dioxygenase-like lactoylglutathione lyase family enzyme
MKQEGSVHDRGYQRCHTGHPRDAASGPVYRALGFEALHGGEGASFTSFRAGTSYLNLIAQPAERRWSWWGRVIFYVSDVDALHQGALAAGYQPTTSPRDAEWGERFFHLTDPDGHELSFARPLRSPM